MRKRYQFLLGTALAVSALALVGPAATRALRFKDDAKPAPPTEIRGQAGLVATIDSETGEIGGPPSGAVLSPEEANSLSTSDEGLVEVHHPDGSVSIDLQGRFESATMARIDANGKVQLYCVDSAKDAQKVLSTPSTSTAGAGLEEE